MKLRILGNNGPYPAPGGACSGFLLASDSGDTTLLIDCGTGVLANLMATGTLNRLDAVILSHLHFDHMSDMLPLQYALQFNPRTAPLPVYAPQTPTLPRQLLDVPCYALKACDDATIGEMRIQFCPARHPVETNAITVTCDGARFVFTGDSNTDAAVARFCADADLLLADAGLSAADHHEKAPHYSAALCGQLARDARAKQLLLTHFNPKYDPRALLDEARAYYPEAQIAETGREYAI